MELKESFILIQPTFVKFQTCSPFNWKKLHPTINRKDSFVFLNNFGCTGPQTNANII